MPFVFVILGLLLIVVAVRGTHGDAFKLLQDEFSGQKSFVVFAAAIMILGAVAYIKPLRPVALPMILLVFLAMFLGNKGGFFKQFNDAIRSPSSPAKTPDSVNIGGTGSGVTVQPDGSKTVPAFPSLGPFSPSVTLPELPKPGDWSRFREGVFKFLGF